MMFFKKDEDDVHRWWCWQGSENKNEPQAPSSFLFFLKIFLITQLFFSLFFYNLIFHLFNLKNDYMVFLIFLIK